MIIGFYDSLILQDRLSLNSAMTVFFRRKTFPDLQWLFDCHFQSNSSRAKQWKAEGKNLWLTHTCYWWIFQTMHNVVLNAIQFMRKVLTLKWKKTTSSVLHVRFSGTYYSNRTSSVHDFRGNVVCCKEWKFFLIRFDECITDTKKKTTSLHSLALYFKVLRDNFSKVT